MAEASPGNLTAQAGIGGTLLDLGRFQEAAAVLEPLWFPGEIDRREQNSRLPTQHSADSEVAALVKQLCAPAEAQRMLEMVRRSAETIRSRRP